MIFRNPFPMRIVAFLALVFLLAACSGPTAVVAPTEDIPKVRTEAVQTVVAKLTIEAALNPTATQPQVATETPAPEATATQEPTATDAAGLPSATPIVAATATTRPATGGGGVVVVTATRRAGPDQAQLVSQEPKDGAVYNPGNEFDGTWTFKNIGTSTWTTGYEYRASGGTNLAKQNRYTLSKSVAPGESITLVTDMVAPPTRGRYVSNWELVNENGDVFYRFYMVIDIP
jgi:hypothetical protein